MCSGLWRQLLTLKLGDYMGRVHTGHSQGWMGSGSGPDNELSGRDMTSPPLSLPGDVPIIAPSP